MFANRVRFVALVGLVGILLTSSSAIVRAADEEDKKAFDKRFVKDAAQYSMVENDISRLVKDHSKSDGVKHYAELVIGGQKKLLEELRDIAKEHKYDVPDEMTDKQRDTKERLSKLNATDFDVEYMSEQVDDHKAMIDLFEKASKDCQDENLRKFADRKLPPLREHLANAEELYKKVKDKKP